jgi:uncharacterized membrane protein
MNVHLDPQHTVIWSRRLAVASLIGLIALSLAWELVLAPLRPGGSWLVLKALPLCLPLAGLLKNRMYTYRWVSLVVWLYFIEGVVRAYGDAWPSNALAGLEIALCLSLFTAAALHVRLRLYHADQVGLGDTVRPSNSSPSNTSHVSGTGTEAPPHP